MYQLLLLDNSASQKKHDDVVESGRQPHTGELLRDRAYGVRRGRGAGDETGAGATRPPLDSLPAAVPGRQGPRDLEATDRRAGRQSRETRLAEEVRRRDLLAG